MLETIKSEAYSAAKVQKLFIPFLESTLAWLEARLAAVDDLVFRRGQEPLAPSSLNAAFLAWEDALDLLDPT